MPVSQSLILILFLDLPEKNTACVEDDLVSKVDRLMSVYNIK